MTQLSANFTLSELTKSADALRKGLDNTPTQAIIDNLSLLTTAILQPVRNNYGASMTINSGYRSLAVNASVGGSATSDHCKGMAADIEIVGVDNATLAKYIADNYDFTQIILEFYTAGIPDSGWVHVSYDKSNLKKQVLTAVKRDNKTVYLPNLVI
ncbi:peptidase M15 [Caudoviricetes sp.]|nr:peptidase M15 [Caudoviricetes sp.]